MRGRTLLAVLLILALTACGPASPPVSPMPSTSGMQESTPASSVPVTGSPADPMHETAPISPRSTVTVRPRPTPTIAYAPLFPLPEGYRLGRGRVTALAWTPDGLLVVGTAIGIYLHDPESLAQVRFLETPAPVQTVAFSPGGDLLAGAGWRDVWLWDTTTWQPLPVLTGGGNRLAFSPDGSLLAVAGYAGLRIWTVGTWQEQFRVGGRWYDLAFSPDGTLLAGGTYATGEEQVHVWNVASWEDRATFPGWQQVAFSPIGNRMAVAGPGPYAWVVAVLETTTWQEVWRADSNCSSLWGCGDITLGFSPDGGLLAMAGTEGEVTIWKAATGQTVHSVLAEAGMRGPVAFSPDTAFLACRTADAQVALWHLEDRRTTLLEGYSDEVESVALSPDGALLASDGVGDGVRVIEATTGRILWEKPGQEYFFRGGTSSLAFSPDGALLATGMLWYNDTGSQGEVRLWKARTGTSLKVLPVVPLTDWEYGAVYSVAFSPDGTLLAAGCHDGTIRLWDTASGAIAQIFTATGGPRSIAFSPDGRLLAAGEGNGDIQLWEIPPGQEIQGFEGLHEVNQVVFAPSGDLLAAVDGYSVHLWDVSRRRLIWSKTADAYGLYHSLAFSPDGTILAVGLGDGGIQLWDAASGEDMQALHRHTQRVHALSFSPDGTLLVSGSADGTVGLWRLGQ